MGEKIKLLFLTASPSAAGQRLRTDEDIRETEEQIRGGPCRDAFAIASALAVRSKDLQEILLRERPHIVHFGGHGESKTGILLEDEIGRPAPVSGEALAGLLRVVGTVRVVLLNACESRAMAEPLQQVVDYTIAMRRRVTDRAAIVFARAFYRGLCHRQTVPEAVELGRNQLMIEGIPEVDVPDLLVRHGVRPQTFVPKDEPAAPAVPRAGHTVTVSVTGNSNDTNTNVR